MEKKNFFKFVLSGFTLSMIALTPLVGCGEQTSSSSEPSSINTDSGEKPQEEAGLKDIYDPERPSYDFDYESGYEKPEPPTGNELNNFVPDVDPAYEKGEETKKFRMEAENAIVKYQGTSSVNWKNTCNDVNNMAFDFRLSNKLCTRNLNQTGTKLIYKYKSDKTYMVKMNLVVSIDQLSKYSPESYFTIKSAGKVKGQDIEKMVDLSDKVINKDDETTKILVSGGQAASQYFRFGITELMVPIFEGDNTLTFEHLTARGGNFDYIEFDTSANISRFDSTHYMDGDVASPETGTIWSVGTLPTEDTDGTFVAKKFMDGAFQQYKYGLPKLMTDGKVTPGYTKTDLGENKAKYSFTFKNSTYSFVVDPNFMADVTVEDKEIKFADGTLTKSFAPGTVLKAEDLSKTSDGRSVEMFKVLNASGRHIDNGVPGKWTVPLEPVTIVPTCYSPEEGYNTVMLNYPNNDELQTSAFFVNKTYLSGETPIKGKGYPQRGKVITCNGSIPTDSAYRIDSPYKITQGTYEFKYNFENKGTNPIKLRVLQFSSSSEYRPSLNGDITMRSSTRYTMIVDLKAGESTTLTAQYKLNANGNQLTYFVADMDMENLCLGMSMAIKSLGDVELDPQYVVEK